MKVSTLDPDDPFLDGDPADFPMREEAMAEYRALWLDFLQGHTDPNYIGRRSAPVEESRRRMDELQPLISRGPGRVWRDFARSLPGYQEWWEGATTEALAEIQRAFEGEAC